MEGSNSELKPLEADEASGDDHLSAAGVKTLYPVAPQLLERLHNNFHYHAPGGDQAARHGALSEAYERLAVLAVRLTPGSREQSLALTALEESKMWASAAIARNEPVTASK